MFRCLGWTEAVDVIIKAINKTIQSKVVTYDFARLMDGAKEVKCSEFGEAIIQNMKSNPAISYSTTTGRPTRRSFFSTAINPAFSLNPTFDPLRIVDVIS